MKITTSPFVYRGVAVFMPEKLGNLQRGERAGQSRERRDWLVRVAKAQEGHYRFLVVFQHYPYFKKSGPCSYGGYEFWRGAFDALGVDFALYETASA